MREALFVKQNKDKWTRFESLLGKSTPTNAKELESLYIDITDDLSYSNTFYPESPTTIYLNALSQRAHLKIYKNKPTPRNAVWNFWYKNFPLLFYKYQKELLFSFLAFALFAAIGAYSAAQDDQFVRMILGDRYVNMTIDNINKGDPMAVYKDANKVDMFLGITINNVRVAFLAFVYGLLLCVGTLYIFLINGVMIGSFQYFFYDQGLLWESARTIWIHGTIEISVIIIAGCGGIVAGKGLLFTGTYTRLQSFMRSLRDGLKIVFSTVPLFILAGFLEGFVTRHTEMPDVLAIAIISISLFIILFYYVYYPIYLNKKTN